jgi:hypothetical protein
MALAEHAETDKLTTKPTKWNHFQWEDYFLLLLVLSEIEKKRPKI